MGATAGTLPDLLQAKNINALAVQSGFTVRKSKVTPRMFLDSLLYNASGDGNKSLNNLSVEMHDAYSVSVTKQGLNGRYTEAAGGFLKALLSQLCFANSSPVDAGWLSHFNRVSIKDSTKFVLPEEYAGVMPGFGGVSSKAAACIQYEYDLKTGSILDLNVTPANRPDSKDARESLGTVMPNDLIIRDLGYYATDVLAAVAAGQAFFVSKLNAKALVFESSRSGCPPLQFSALYRWMKKHNVQQVEKQVYIGAAAQLPCRLVASLVPEDVFAQRMHKVNKCNKRRGHATSEDYAHRARFNLIVTNTPSEAIPARVAVDMYRVRWQVELVFKAWKSTFGVHKIGKMKYYRWLCILYARLILVVLYWQTAMPLRTALYKAKGKLLSLDKCFKTMKAYTNRLREAARKGKRALEQLIAWLQALISDKHWLEKKKNKLNFEQIIYSEYCRLGIYVYL